MNDDINIDLKLQFTRFARAVKLGFCVIFCLLSFFNILLPLVVIPRLVQFREDIVSEQSVRFYTPAISGFVIGNRWVLVAIGMALLLAGIMACRAASPARTVTTITVLTVVIFVQFVVTGYALFDSVSVIVGGGASGAHG